MSVPEPVFEAPWHAQIFALTVHLNETGHFEWADWAAAFGATLKRHGVHQDLNGGEDYFSAWLETLEDFLAKTGMADPGQLARLKAAWEMAYLATPHGAPVSLNVDDALGQGQDAPPAVPKITRRYHPHQTGRK